MKNKLIIQAENEGDMSVGLTPLTAKITIEINGDAEEVLRDIHMQDNIKEFAVDVNNLLSWFDDMPCKIYSIKTK